MKAFRSSSKKEFVQSEKNCQMKALSIIVEYFYFGNIATYVKCKDCKKTILKGNLKRHFERKHKDEPKNYSCNICEKQFASKNSKDFHVKKVH